MATVNRDSSCFGEFYLCKTRVLVVGAQFLPQGGMWQLSEPELFYKSRRCRRRRAHQMRGEIVLRAPVEGLCEIDPSFFRRSGYTRFGNRNQVLGAERCRVEVNAPIQRGLLIRELALISSPHKCVEQSDLRLDLRVDAPMDGLRIELELSSRPDGPKEVRVSGPCNKRVQLLVRGNAVSRAFNVEICGVNAEEIRIHRLFDPFPDRRHSLAWVKDFQGWGDETPLTVDRWEQGNQLYILIK